VETSPQPSPERRGRSISPLRGVCISFPPLSGEDKRRGFHCYFLPLSGGDTEGVSTGGNLTPALSCEEREKYFPSQGSLYFISSPVRGGQKEGFPLFSCPLLEKRSCFIKILFHT